MKDVAVIVIFNFIKQLCLGFLLVTLFTLRHNGMICIKLTKYCCEVSVKSDIGKP